MVRSLLKSIKINHVVNRTPIPQTSYSDTLSYNVGKLHAEKQGVATAVYKLLDVTNDVIRPGSTICEECLD